MKEGKMHTRSRKTVQVAGKGGPIAGLAERMVTRQTTRRSKQADDLSRPQSALASKRQVVVKVKKQASRPQSASAAAKKTAMSQQKSQKTKQKKSWSVKASNLEDKKSTKLGKGKTVKQVKVGSKKAKEDGKANGSNRKKVDSKINEKASKAKPVKVAKLTTVALKRHELRNDDLVTIRPPNRGDSWNGNSEADGSVNSGILDENLCFACGEVTTEEEVLETVICDICGGEYHFRCVGLEILPRLAYKCPDCESEIAWNLESNKSLGLLEKVFPIPPRKRGSKPPEVCYSPSRPLNVAWQECETKGFMMVKKVFSTSIIDKLLHGGLQRVTKYGRIADNWTGAVDVLSSQINTMSHNVINRDGRYDIKIPQFVVDDLHLEAILSPILTKLKTIMSPFRTPHIRTHNIIFAPVGSESQSWHYDDSMQQGKYHKYFTVLIHLNSIDDLCGGTEIWCKKIKRGDLIRGRPGDAFVFNGSLLHRGQGNHGFTHRWFYYASFSCTKDANEMRN